MTSGRGDGGERAGESCAAFDEVVDRDPIGTGRGWAKIRAASRIRCLIEGTYSGFPSIVIATGPRTPDSGVADVADVAGVAAAGRV